MSGAGRGDADGAATGALVRVRNLSVRYAGAAEDAVHGIDLDIAAGEVIALVGESGSGKSTVANSLLGLLGGRARVSARTLEIDGRDLRAAPQRVWRSIRGPVLARVPQDPLAALNPNQRIGAQLAEAVRGRADRDALVREALREAGVPRPEEMIRRFPHEVSGGQRQRALIALAFITSPRILVADEPTSSVDASTRRHIADRLGELARARNAGMLLITHDLALATELGDRTLVLHDGRIVEHGSSARIAEDPRSAEARELLDAARALSLAAVAAVAAEPERPAPRAGDPLLALEGVSVRYGSAAPALQDVSLTLSPGETLGVVGESGAGKSTLVRAALALAPLAAGRVRFGGIDLATCGAARLRALRRRFQLVQQDPFASLDPRYTVARCIAEPLRAFRVGSRREQTERVRELLELVRLPPALADRRPRQLSGGQRQRVAIARALALDPELVLLDEALSALDPSVQAALLALLEDLQRDRGTSFLFVSHDLGVVSRLAHRLAVFQDGRLVEVGTTSDLLRDPHDPYTRLLVDAARRSSLA